ncbi:MAG TPA: crosslink repair DNA glycosylase YcaQ family protein [Acidimicrobiales bacterium]|nr:crosslink repair DNA glycosylase YcaQ family protein [Acidimicrobiales bacterium]
MAREAQVSRTAHITASEARWLAIAAQGLAAPRPAATARPATARPAGAAQLRALMGKLGTIQLDAVNVLARTQLVVPFSRLGSYDVSAMQRLSAPGGHWFEYWGHAASLLPLELHPLFRWRMQRWREDLADSLEVGQRRHAWRVANGEYLAAVLAEVEERGPISAAQLSDPRRRSGTWWDRRSDGRRALETLFADGVLAAWRNPSFERVYDLAERAIPCEVLDLPTPAEDEAQRQLVLIAARCLGVGTSADLGDYFWLRRPTVKERVAELVEDGQLVEVEVEGWRAPAYALPGVKPRPPRRRHATLLTPFDSLIWSRERTERLFGFRYRVEIYVPAPKRTHGYYVLPLLLGDRLVARLDLKSDRAGRALRVVGAFDEPGTDRAEVAVAALAELDALGEWLGLDELAVSERGDLAVSLAALGAARMA